MGLKGLLEVHERAVEGTCSYWVTLVFLQFCKFRAQSQMLAELFSIEISLFLPLFVAYDPPLTAASDAIPLVFVCADPLSLEHQSHWIITSIIIT